MFLHYLKTALRNIKKNPVYSTLSICCLAIGTAVFANLFYIINYDEFYENRYLLDKRTAMVYPFFPDLTEENQNTPHYYTRPTINAKYLPLLKNMPEIESVSARETGGTGINLIFYDQDKTYGLRRCKLAIVNGDYYKFHHLTLLYGDRVPQNENEIVVTESLLKRMGFDKDISQCVAGSPDPLYSMIKYKIVNVIRDDRWCRSQDRDIFLYTNIYLAEMGLFNDVQVYADVTMAQGTTMDDINRKLKSQYIDDGVGPTAVFQLANDYKNPNERWDNFISNLLSLILLLIAATNFLKHTVLLFKQRSRGNIIRYSLGAKPDSLSLMMAIEVSVILLSSLVLALLISFFVCQWVNTGEDLKYTHFPDLVLVNLLTIGALAAVSYIICRLAVYSQNRQLKNRIVVTSHEKTALKYIVICIEMSVAMYVLASILYISLIMPKPYNNLSRSESRRTYFVETGSVMQPDEKERLNRLIKSNPQVEEMVYTHKEWHERDELGRIKTDDIWLEVKSAGLNYFEFFNIPIEWIDAVHPSNGYLISRIAYDRLLADTVSLDNLDLQIMSTNSLGLESGPVHISGIFDNLMCGTTHELVYYLFRYEDNPDPAKSNYFIRFKDDISQLEVQELITGMLADINPNYIDNIRVESVPKYNEDTDKFVILFLRLGCIVSLLLVVLSVTSSISAETNIRRKEVSLRKINGAKAADIAKMFVKPYTIVLLIAFVTGNLTCTYTFRSDLEWNMILVAPLTLIIMVLIVALSIFSRIRRIMRTNPADVIKSD